MLGVEHLYFKPTEKILHCTIIHTIFLAGHTLFDIMLRKQSLIFCMLVLLTLVRDDITDYVTAVQIQDSRKIQLLSKQTKLCHSGEHL